MVFKSLMRRAVEDHVRNGTHVLRRISSTSEEDVEYAHWMLKAAMIPDLKAINRLWSENEAEQ